MYGNFTFPGLPFQAMPGGALRTPLGTLIAPGALIHYLRSSGAQTYDPPEIAGRIHTTLNAAAAQCRSGAGDVVAVLPGHAENIASADQITDLKAGTKIIGIGGDDTGRGTFTWTTATSSFLLDVANVTLENLRLLMDPGTGTTNVAAPITVSAAGCAIKGCQIRMGTDANSKVTIGITTTAAATDLKIIGNDVYGATAAEATTFFQFVGADRLRFIGNTILGATSSVSVGTIRFLTTASTGIRIYANEVANMKASSQQAITGMAGLTGYVNHLHMHVLSDNVAALTGAFSTPGSVSFGRQCYVSNLAGERAALFGTESA